jgi:hypothetical protein
MAVVWPAQHHRTFPGTTPEGQVPAVENGQRTAPSDPNNANFNDHPTDAAGAELACAYYGRRLRSLPFPGKRPCSARECCLHRGPVLSGSPWILLAGETGALGYGQPGMRVRPAAPP